MYTSRVRNWSLFVGVGLGVVGFAGCSADAGGDEAPVETVEVAAVACESFTGTIAQHQQAGRVKAFTFFVFIFPITSYTVVGSNEELGSNANQRVTLYRRQAGGFTTSATDCGARCGDGVLNAGEQCDGSPTTTCAEHGFPSGTPKCTSTCINDISECSSNSCGDGVVQADEREECDGTNLPHKTCAEYRSEFTGGAMKCTSGCQYDLSGCIKPCGNGVIDGDEQCDGAARAPQYANLKCTDVNYPDPAFPFLNYVKYPGGTIECSYDCKLAPVSCTAPTGCFFRTLSTSGPQLYCQ